MQVRLLRLTVLVVALSVAVGACGRYSISSIRSAKAFQDANSLYKKQDYEGALARYQDAVNLNPDLNFAYFFLGHSHEQLYKPARKDDPANMEHLREAAKNYRMAVDRLKGTTDPNEQRVQRWAFEYLIAVYGPDKLNDFAQAEPIARELIALDPKDPTTYRILAKLYEDQGDFEKAEQEYLRSIDAQPNDPVGYQMLARFYNDRGNFPKTMEAWDKRAAIEPKNPEAWHTIGVYYQEYVFKNKALARATAMDYVLKALAAEDKALELNQNYYEALVFKNILLRQQALYEKDPAKIKALISQADQIQKQFEALKARETGTGGK